MRFSRSLALLVIAALPAFAQDVPQASGGATVSGAVADVAAAPAPSVPSRSPVAAALAGLSADPVFTSAAVSLQVVNVRTGEEVYAWGEDKQLVPASTMKLLTIAAALRALGPDFRFPTWFLHDGELGSDGRLVGNLYVKGQGDPTMVVERMWRIAQDLRNRGVREVQGDIVFDDSYFSGTTMIPGWNKEEDLENGPTYFASLGALSVNYNVATIVVRPGAGAGQPAVVELDTPTSAVVVESQVTTGRKGSSPRIGIERTLDEETGKITTFKLTGTYPAEGDTQFYYRTIADPLGNYIGALQSVFKQQGIKVSGRWRPGATARDAKLLYKAESVSLTEIVATTSKHSNNFMAEQILRSVGAERYGLPGTTESGLRVVGDYLTSLGIPASEYHLVNGSGLARDLMLRPSTLNGVLLDMYRSPEVGPEFVASLSVGGRDGTLWSRFRDEAMAGRVRGKTGTLAGVHCLSGYVHASDDETYAFTFLVNEVEGALSRVRKAHDRLVLAVAGTTDNLADVGEPENAVE
jgi:D-alanyl-D-alanine carboxypeptidase/D-alanyl-D-alanine-endopeptidase (penicillin-binding protein 4)